ncbi:hypothetical protein SAMN05216503_1145 [Polaribacter sp. KT25b]|nr:hypothetical protein SAMN05216503_1145 [Polaribacter sp. KT25b]
MEVRFYNISKTKEDSSVVIKVIKKNHINFKFDMVF